MLWDKRKIKCLVIVALTFLLGFSINAAEVKKGYSEWTTEVRNDENGISEIQYGVKLPLVWSPWSSQVPESLYYRKREGNINKYSYDGEVHFWKDVNKKELFTWDFEEKKHITYFYADVDTYADLTYTAYEGPPLKLYCDGSLIASTPKHNYLNNWNPDIDCNCRYLRLDMDKNSGSGRNMTVIVGTWASYIGSEYSYVEKWDEGSGWRFDEEYEHIYLETPQIPVERTVYSYPIKYHLNYDLDGGEFVGKVINEYTILDEIVLPSAVKKGYDFRGWYIDDCLLSKINIGTTGDLNLLAHYARKKPSIYISGNKIIREDTMMNAGAFIRLLNGKAYDELDGNISNKITVSKIIYEDGRAANYPSDIDVSTTGVLTATFEVINSGGIKDSLTKKIYVLGTSNGFDVDDELIIAPRYISEEYLDTLKADSIWRSEEYVSQLNDAFEKARKDRR